MQISSYQNWKYEASKKLIMGLANNKIVIDKNQSDYDLN